MWPLFCAECLIADGVSPRWLMRSVNLDTRELDLVKYWEDQPRVPAGSGIESGRWTFNESASAQDKPIVIAVRQPSLKPAPKASGPHTTFRRIPPKDGPIFHYQTHEFNERREVMSKLFDIGESGDHMIKCQHRARRGKLALNSCNPLDCL
jgi:hypothetical protein